jgi:hypothetical protein
MPNIVGGDQMHPAYGLGEVGPNEVLIGNRLYKIKGTGESLKVDFEDIDGNGGSCVLEHLPTEVKRKIRTLERKAKRKPSAREQSRAKSKLLENTYLVQCEVAYNVEATNNWGSDYTDFKPGEWRILADDIFDFRRQLQEAKDQYKIRKVKSVFKLVAVPLKGE